MSQTSQNPPEISAGIRQVIWGKGQDITPSLAGMRTMVPLLYSPYDNDFSPTLIQGGISTRVVEMGIGVSWPTLYAYRPLPGQERHSLVKGAKEPVQGWERFAFRYAAHIYHHTLEAIGKYQVEATRIIDGTKDIEVRLDQAAALADRIDLELLSEAMAFQLREHAGFYSWIGLKGIRASAQPNSRAQEFPITSMIRVRKILNSKDDIDLIGHTVPRVPGTNDFIHPKLDNTQQAIMCGLVHAFESQPVWNASTAIDAALLSYVYNYDFGTDKTIASAARIGIYPGLGSMVYREDMRMWRKLLALSIAHGWFKRRYIPAWTNNIGEARYIFSGTGLTQALEAHVNYYARSAMINVTDTSASSANGLFFFPGSNYGADGYKWAFVENPRSPNDLTTLHPTDISGRVVARYADTPLTVGRDGVMDISEDMQQDITNHPVVTDPAHSVRSVTKFLGGGLLRRSTIINAEADDTPYHPSQMIRTLIVGWAPAYPAQAMVMRNAPSPTFFREYDDFLLSLGPVFPGKGSTTKPDVPRRPGAPTR